MANNHQHVRKLQCTGGGKKNINYCYIGELHFLIRLVSLLKSIIEAVYSVQTHTDTHLHTNMYTHTRIILITLFSISLMSKCSV